MIFMQVDAFILQHVEITFHRCIVIWISGSAHALCHVYGFAEFCECPGSVLRSLIRMQKQFSSDCRLGIQRLLQRPYRKVARDMTVCNAGDNTPVIESDDAAVVPHIMIFQEQIREICTPFLIDSICGKLLFQLVIKHFMRFPMHIIWFFRADDGMKPQFRIHILMDGCRAVTITLPLHIDSHAPVTVNAIVFVVNFFYLCQNL